MRVTKLREVTRTRKGVVVVKNGLGRGKPQASGPQGKNKSLRAHTPASGYKDKAQRRNITQDMQEAGRKPHSG